MDKNRLLRLLTTVLWTAAVIGYFFQFPVSFLAVLITPCGVAYVLLQFPKYFLLKNKVYLTLLGAFFVYLGYSVVEALVWGTEFVRVLRFGAILALLPLCCLIHEGEFETKWKILFRLAVAKAGVLLLIWLALLIVGDYTAFRDWAWENGFGDIYLLSRWNAKVQVHGNALLLVAFIVDYSRKKRFTIQNGIVLAGILAAGNFAFILGVGAFFAWQGFTWVREKKISKCTVAAVLVCGLLLGAPYVAGKIVQKAEVSNKTRLEQAQVLLNANPLIGEGLGNYIRAQTSTRNYDGDLYFELQTLYIYNQVGLFGLGLSYYLTVLPLWRKGRSRVLLYLIYLVYSFWNPYCWDMTHIITLQILMNTQDLGVNHGKSDYYSLPSLCKRGLQRRSNREAGG